MEFYNALNQGQTQAGAFVMAVEGAVNLNKGLKQVLEFFWGNANAGIGYRNMYSRI